MRLRNMQVTLNVVVEELIEREAQLHGEVQKHEQELNVPISIITVKKEVIKTLADARKHIMTAKRKIGEA